MGVIDAITRDLRLGDAGSGATSASRCCPCARSRRQWWPGHRPNPSTARVLLDGEHRAVLAPALSGGACLGAGRIRPAVRALLDDDNGAVLVPTRGGGGPGADPVCSAARALLGGEHGTFLATALGGGADLGDGPFRLAERALPDGDDDGGQGGGGGGEEQCQHSALGTDHRLF